MTGSTRRLFSGASTRIVPCNVSIIFYVACAAAFLLLVFSNGGRVGPDPLDDELAYSGQISSTKPKTPLSIVRPHKVNAKLLPSNLFSGAEHSKENSPGISVLFVSKTAPANFKRRRLIRKGWLSAARLDSKCWCSLNDSSRCTAANRVCQHGNMKWAHRFAMGSSALPKELVNPLNTELEQQSDFLLYPGADTYRRLTWKVMWILKHLSNSLDVDYIVLLDDDCFVQLWRVSQYLQTAARQRFYAGHVSYAVGVSRMSWSRWHVSKAAYDAASYPPYVWGAGLFISKDAALTAVDAAAHWPRPWFGVDDAFMGVMMNNSGVAAVDIAGIYTAGYHKAFGCLSDYTLPESQPLIVAGNEAEILRCMSTVARKESLCKVLDGPVREFLLFVSSPHLPWAIVVFLMLAGLMVAVHRCGLMRTAV